jgi:N-acyl amino acid synthase of PEP-CTERM/exosortase system
VPSASSAALKAECPDATLLERLNFYFDTLVADTPSLLRQAHEIRYAVYCVETGFEDAASFPDGLERDALDAHAVHGLLVHRSTARPVGTVRLVLPVQQALLHSFAVQGVSDHPAFRNSTLLPLASTAEVSRFCISRQFRRRATDTMYDEPETAPARVSDRRGGPLMRLGLIQVLVRMSAQHGITHWCALMEPTLLRMLDAMAIRFTRLGPLVDHHGLRQPCVCDIAEALAAVRRERPEYWDVLTSGGNVIY